MGHKTEVQHSKSLLNRWSFRDSDSFFFGDMKLSKCDCLFQGLAEKSLLMNEDRQVITFTIKDSLWNSTSTKKHSLIFAFPIDWGWLKV